MLEFAPRSPPKLASIAPGTPVSAPELTPAPFREDPPASCSSRRCVQMATAVINLDLPWNIRQARAAHRAGKGQKSAATVVNSSPKIPSSIRSCISSRRSRRWPTACSTGRRISSRSRCAATSSACRPCGRRRAAIRIKTLPPEEALVEDMKARHGARLLHAELRPSASFLLDAVIAAERIRRLLDAGERNSRSRRVGGAERLADAGLIGFGKRAAISPERGERGDGCGGQDKARFDPRGRLIARG